MGKNYIIFKTKRNFYKLRMWADKEIAVSVSRSTQSFFILSLWICHMRKRDCCRKK